MSRRDLELRAKKELESEGWKVERAVSKAVFTPKGFVARSFDFFNCFDLIAVRKGTRFIQITSSDVSARTKKSNPNQSLNFRKRKIDELWDASLPDPEIFHYVKEGNRWIQHHWIRINSKWNEIPNAIAINDISQGGRKK